MEVRTLEFADLAALAKAFERLATDARVEFCEADPTRLSLRFALGLAPVLPATRPDLSGRRSRLAR
jgi:hypothetical protein